MPLILVPNSHFGNIHPKYQPRNTGNFKNIKLDFNFIKHKCLTIKELAL